MFYLIIEHFKNGDAKPVYRRFVMEEGLPLIVLLMYQAGLMKLCSAVFSLWKQMTANILMNGFQTGMIL